MVNSVKAHVNVAISTRQASPLGGPANELFAIHGPNRLVQPGPLGPIVGISNPPMASGGGGAGASSKAGGASGNSGPSDSNEINPDDLDAEGGDLDKIKELEKELKKKEEAQKAEEKRINEEEEKLKLREAEANKIEDTKKKAEELQKIKEEKAKLEEDKKKLELDKKVTTEQRKQLDEVIAPPFAQKNDDGTIKKDKNLDIQFLDKESIGKIKNLLKTTNPNETQQEEINKIKDAIREYRKAYPKQEEQELQTIQPQNTSASVQKQTGMSGPSRYANALNTLDFEEASV